MHVNVFVFFSTYEEGKGRKRESGLISLVRSLNHPLGFVLSSVVNNQCIIIYQIPQTPCHVYPFQNLLTFLVKKNLPPPGVEKKMPFAAICHFPPIGIKIFSKQFEESMNQIHHFGITHFVRCQVVRLAH